MKQDTSYWRQLGYVGASAYREVGAIERGSDELAFVPSLEADAATLLQPLMVENDVTAADDNSILLDFAFLRCRFFFCKAQ